MEWFGKGVEQANKLMKSNISWK